MQLEARAMEKNKENCIEWLTGQDTIVLSLTQERFINKIGRLRKKYPDLIKVP